MLDKNKTKKQLLEEINEYRSKFIELEKANSDYIQARERLSESEKKYKNLIDTANDAILMADAETGIIIGANKRAEELLGLTTVEIVGMHQSKIHPEEEAEKYRKKFQAHIKHGHAIEENIYVINKKGEKIPVEVSSSITEIGGKRIIQGIFRNITRRKKAEEALIRREKELAESQKVAMIGSWDWDIVSNRITWSEELFNRFGVSPQDFEATFEAFLSMVHPDDRERLDKEVKRSVRDKTPYHIDVRIINPDGRRWIMEARGVVTCDESGNPVRMGGTAQDITMRKNAENKMKKSEEKFRSIVNSTDDSMYMVDRDYRYLFMNRQHISRLGLSEDQYMNRAYSEFHSPEETRLFIEKVNKVFHSGNAYQYEFKSVRDEKYFLQTFSPVKESNKELTAVNVISKEITTFKYAEERLYSMTITDELTGLYNRRGFLTLSDQQLKLANRDNKKMFLMSSDLDYLKLINDNMGHKAGDRALINTASILKETFRESDVIARMGGDEFVVLGMITPYSGIDTLTERLNENLKIHNSLTNVPLEDISLSFGFAVYDPSQPCSIEELLTNADELMYMHKRNKR